MKAIPIVILFVAVLFGFRQAGVSADLSKREKELLARKAVLQSGGGTGTEHATGEGKTSPATKTGREKKPKFDTTAYLERFKKIVSRPEDLYYGSADEKFLHEELLLATPADIDALSEQLRGMDIPDGFKSFIHECIAPLVVDKNPVAAAEFAIIGGDIETFYLVMRRWIARDPVAAHEWIEAGKAGDPPLNEKSFHTHASHLEPLDVPSLQLASSLLVSPGTADLSHLLKQEGGRLKEGMDDVMKVLPPEGLPSFLKRLHGEGRDDLVEIALKQHPDPALAREHLKEAGLPSTLFLKEATDLVLELDPVGMPSGVEWFLRSTADLDREDNLRKIITTWTRENPGSATKWIGQLPAGKDREIAEGAHAAALAEAKSKLLPGS